MARDDVTDLVLAVVPGQPRYWAATVGINARVRRQELGWSQAELARRLTLAGWAVSADVVRSVELHRPSVIRVDDVVVLGQVLGVSVTQLLDDGWQRKLRDLQRLNERWNNP